MAKEGKKRGGYSTITGRKQARKMNMKILANQKDFNEIKYADFLENQNANFITMVQLQ